MKIEIETKFDLGQKVYRKSDGLYVEILSMELRKNDDRIECSYCCHEINGNLTMNCLEDVLTAKRPKPKSVYDLKVGDEYFLLQSNGYVDCIGYDDDEDDRKIIEHGFGFLTKEEAEKEAKRLAIHQRLKRLAGGYKFKPEKENYYIRILSRSDDSMALCVTREFSSFESCKVYFGSKEDVKYAVKEIGEETLLRDYFGIKD